MNELGPEEEFFFALYMVAIIATVIMLYLTEPVMPKPSDEQRIFAMLDDAGTNGYDITTWTADDIVADLLAYADLKESDTEETIKPHVIKWKMGKVDAN